MAAWSREVLALAAVAAAFLVGAAPAAASCVGEPVPFTQALASAPLVFVGTVTATADQERTATVHVDELWKGPPLPAQVTLRGSPDTSAAATSVDRHYKEGLRYLFVPAGEAGPPFDDNSCTLTREFTADVKALRPASVRSYPPATPSPPLPVILVGGIVLLVTAGYLIRMVRLRGAQTTVR